MKRNLSITLCLCVGLFGCTSTYAPKTDLLSQLKHDELKELVQAHIDEYESTKPSIERLVELEGDLRVLVAQIADYQLNIEEDKPEGLAEVTDEQDDNLPVAIQPANRLPAIGELVASSVDSDDSNVLITNEDDINENIIENTLPSKELENTATLINGVVVLSTPDAAIKPPMTEVEPMIDTPSDMGGIKSYVSITSPASEEAFSTCPPRSVQTNANQFGVHVSSFKYPALLKGGWENAVKAYPNLCDKGAVYKTVAVQNHTFYSLRVGPYVTKDAAKKMCQALRQQKQYCRVTDFTGEVL